MFQLERTKFSIWSLLENVQVVSMPFMAKFSFVLRFFCVRDHIDLSHITV